MQAYYCSIIPSPSGPATRNGSLAFRRPVWSCAQSVAYLLCYGHLSYSANPSSWILRYPANIARQNLKALALVLVVISSPCLARRLVCLCRLRSWWSDIRMSCMLSAAAASYRLALV